jgi:hypothetical protein
MLRMQAEYSFDLTGVRKEGSNAVWGENRKGGNMHPPLLRGADFSGQGNRKTSREVLNEMR